MEKDGQAMLVWISLGREFSETCLHPLEPSERPSVPLSTVYPMEVAVWGNCCCSGGCGTLCGHRCQELITQVSTTTSAYHEPHPVLHPLGSLPAACPGPAPPPGQGSKDGISRPGEWDEVLGGW